MARILTHHSRYLRLLEEARRRSRYLDCHSGCNLRERLGAKRGDGRSGVDTLRPFAQSRLSDKATGGEARRHEGSVAGPFAGDYFQFLMFDKALRRFAPDEIIAVDLRALAIVQHSLPQVPVNLVSLEIPEPGEHKEQVVEQRISRVIIQSQARLERLFNGAKPKTFFVQNAPTFRTFALETSNRMGLVFCGAAV